MTKHATGRTPEMRRRVLLTGVLLTALVSAGRAFQLGVLDGESWRLRALDQQGDTLSLPAPRGTIYDRDGMPLASSVEVFSVAIAPREFRDADRVAALLREHLGLTRQQATRYTTAKRTWIPLPGRYGPDVREALDGVQGVHFERVQQRFYPNGEVARELLGPVGLDGVAQGGLELEFDSVLRGRPGRAVVRRDSRGRPLPGAMLRAVEPTPGRDLFLTIDHDLQEIAEQALRDALARTQAVGGELLLTDPETGDVLAAVSRREGSRARSWRAVTEPYEPGSTIKPFTVAALLRLQRAGLADSVFAEEGRYQVFGRTLTDVHGYGWLTLAEALRVSSNIAVAKVGARMQPGEHFAALRDFGFGTPTGVSYPSESGGRLRRPTHWSKQSAASLAIGYELSVTPLQMAMAYGALANGGTLLEPRLVREVRSRDGRVERRFEPRPVRRVIPDAVATELRSVLADAVEDGTGRAAALGPFSVAGKTGTVRIAEQGRYRPGAYYASFAGFFPADDPQLVIVVKLDEPQGRYYGGATAAPVTRATLEAVLAARNSPIDRSAVARPATAPTAAGPLAWLDGASVAGQPLPADLFAGQEPAAADPSSAPLPLPADASAAPSHAGPAHVVVLQRGVVSAAGPAQAGVLAADAELTLRPEALSLAGPSGAGPLPVPDVRGMPLRDGVRRLHAAGFRVRVEGSGRVLRTLPAGGGAAPASSVIRVIGEGPA